MACFTAGSKKDSTDLYTFASKASYYSKIKVYRPKAKIEKIERKNFTDLQRLIAENKLKLIFEYQNEWTSKNIIQIYDIGYHHQ